jgi:hypothetical protein
MRGIIFIDDFWGFIDDIWGFIDDFLGFIDPSEQGHPKKQTKMRPTLT